MVGLWSELYILFFWYLTFDLIKGHSVEGKLSSRRYLGQSSRIPLPRDTYSLLVVFLLRFNKSCAMLKVL